MKKPKTNAQRQRERTERMKDAGYKLLRNFWAYPENEEAIRKYAERLDRKLERQ